MMSQNLKSILYGLCLMLLSAFVSYLFFSLVPSKYTDLILIIAGGVCIIGYIIWYSIWGIQQIVDDNNEEVKRIIEDSEDAFSEID